MMKKHVVLFLLFSVLSVKAMEEVKVPKFKIEWGACTTLNRDGKKQNGYYMCATEPSKNNVDILADGTQLFGVFDGHIDDNVAEDVTRKILCRLDMCPWVNRDNYEKYFPDCYIFRKIFKAFNKVEIDRKEAWNDQEVAACMAYFKNEKLYLINIGNYRAVVGKKSEKKGELLLSKRLLGNVESKTLDEAPSPDVQNIDLPKDSESYIVIASDGFWDGMETMDKTLSSNEKTDYANKRVIELVQQYASKTNFNIEEEIRSQFCLQQYPCYVSRLNVEKSQSNEDSNLATIAEFCVQKAAMNRSKDNMTVVVIKVTPKSGADDGKNDSDNESSDIGNKYSNTVSKEGGDNNDNNENSEEDSDDLFSVKKMFPNANIIHIKDPYNLNKLKENKHKVEQFAGMVNASNGSKKSIGTFFNFQGTDTTDIKIKGQRSPLPLFYVIFGGGVAFVGISALLYYFFYFKK